MLSALLKGKLSSEQENMEDILTSSVFGTFQYSRSTEALIQFLQQSKAVYGYIPFENDADGLYVNFDDYDFWPRWAGVDGVNNCEPDLVIKIHRPKNQDILIAIEAKFHAGKSALPSLEGNISDQLAKQWVHLHHKAQKKSCIPWLIYLTADTGVPEREILEAKDELFSKPGFSTEAQQLRISWLSWRELSSLFKHSDKQQLSDLSLLARYLGLTYYEGMGGFCQLPEFQYQFRTDFKGFEWGSKRVMNSIWEFNNGQ